MRLLFSALYMACRGKVIGHVLDAHTLSLTRMVSTLKRWKQCVKNIPHIGQCTRERPVAAWTQGYWQYRCGTCGSMANGLLIPQFGIEKTRSIAVTQHQSSSLVGVSPWWLQNIKIRAPQYIQEPLSRWQIAGKDCGTMSGGNHVEHVDNNHLEPYLQDQISDLKNKRLQNPGCKCQGWQLALWGCTKQTEPIGSNGKENTSISFIYAQGGAALSQMYFDFLLLHHARPFKNLGEAKIHQDSWQAVAMSNLHSVAPLPSSATRPKSSILGRSQEKLGEDSAEIKLQKHARAKYHLYHIQF